MMKATQIFTRNHKPQLPVPGKTEIGRFGEAGPLRFVRIRSRLACWSG